MDFDSIEGLDENEINKLYDSINSGELISGTLFICACRANLGNFGAHLVHAPTQQGFCLQRADSSLVFSQLACQSKCDAMQGGTHALHFHSTLEGSSCETKSGFCSSTTGSHNSMLGAYVCTDRHGASPGANYLLGQPGCKGQVKWYCGTFSGYATYAACQYESKFYGDHPRTIAFGGVYATYGACYYLRNR